MSGPNTKKLILPTRIQPNRPHPGRHFLWTGLATLIILCLSAASLPAQDTSPETGEPPVEPVLMMGTAVICEKVRNHVPHTEAIAFSVKLGRVFCFTDFFSVSDRTLIYHNWYRKDQRYASVKLSVRPPRWATYSSIKFGAAQKGPWRVDITDSSGNVLRVLQFSIID